MEMPHPTTKYSTSTNFHFPASYKTKGKLQRTSGVRTLPILDHETMLLKIPPQTGLPCLPDVGSWCSGYEKPNKNNKEKITSTKNDGRRRRCRSPDRVVPNSSTSMLAACAQPANKKRRDQSNHPGIPLVGLVNHHNTRTKTKMKMKEQQQQRDSATTATVSDTTTVSLREEPGNNAGAPTTSSESETESINGGVTTTHSMQWSWKDTHQNNINNGSSTNGLKTTGQPREDEEGFTSMTTEERNSEVSTVCSTVLDQAYTFLAMSEAKWEPETDGENITVPHPHDVLAGQGKSVTEHPGNIIFRMLCAKVHGLYMDAPRLEKAAIADIIIIRMKEDLDPPSRFLQQKGRFFRELDHPKAIKKTCSTLRENRLPIPQDIFLATTIGDSIVVKKSPNDSAATNDVVVVQNTKKKTTKVKEDSRPVKKKRHPHSNMLLVRAGEDGDDSRGAVIRRRENDGVGVDSVRLGSRISIFWPDDDMYYPARVLDRNHNHFHLEYEDGVVEWLDLTMHQFKLLPSPRQQDAVRGM